MHVTGQSGGPGSPVTAALNPVEIILFTRKPLTPSLMATSATFRVITVKYNVDQDCACSTAHINRKEASLLHLNLSFWYPRFAVYSDFLKLGYDARVSCHDEGSNTDIQA